MTNFKKATLASILILILIIGITVASFAENAGIITKEAKLRKTTSNDSTVLEIIPNKEEVEILAEDGDWYQVRYNKIKGYVLKDYIKVKEQETENNNTIAQDNINQKIEKGATITTNAETNLYIRPLINSRIIKTLEKGKNIAIIEIVNEWAYVNIDANNGWIRIDSLGINNNEQQQEQQEENKNNNSNTEQKTQLNKTGYITSTGINFREEPNTESKVIKVFAQNAKVTILEEDGDWYKVNSNDKIGYVLKTYVSSKKVETTSRGSVDRTQRTNKETENKENANVATNTTTQTTNNQTSNKGKEVANYAKQFIGSRYIYGGASPKGFDCSGLTMYVYKKFGVSLPHSATAQSKRGTTVSRSNLQPGDLVFFKDYRTNKGIGHVGIYIGNNKFVHASTEKTGVITSTLSGSYSSRYVKATRIF